MESNFDTFWKFYPNRKGKGAARTAYEKQEKLYGDPLEFIKAVTSAITIQTTYRKQQQSAGVFVPQWKNPATWLNQECWTDEVRIEPKEKPLTVGAQCAKCSRPAMGERFTLCEEHEAWRKGQTLVEEVAAVHAKLSQECKTTDEWRAKFKELAAVGLGGNCGKTMS